MAGHQMHTSEAAAELRPASVQQNEAAHRRLNSSETGRHDSRAGLRDCGEGGDQGRVPGRTLEGQRDYHSSDYSSDMSRTSRCGASADRWEGSARRGRVNESWIPPPSRRLLQPHGWQTLILLALGLALLLPGAGAQQCGVTGPEGFTVVCSAGGSYVEISGGSSWRRCIKKICSPYPPAPGTVRTPTSSSSFPSLLSLQVLEGP